jgi:Protein of unknown function (DUF3592)
LPLSPLASCSHNCLVAAQRRGRGRVGAGQRFGLRHVVVLVLTAGFGVVLLTAGLDRWHDHQVLASRGLTATALITEVHSGRGGPSVDVRFTTAAGQEITTRVGDADSPGGLREGGAIAVRYDPLDAAGRIESARSGNAVATEWSLIVFGVLLLALVGYGAGWWAWRAVRR